MRDAEEQAQNGGSVLGAAREAMQRISSSSGRISDIVELIDGIAFQTNLLALNAAVEAARAGDVAAASRSSRPRCGRWRSALPGRRRRSRA